MGYDLDKDRLKAVCSAETVDLSAPPARKKGHDSELVRKMNFILPAGDPPIAHLIPFGESSFSHVFRGHIVEGTEKRQPVAVKVMKYDGSSSFDALKVQSFREEVRIHREIEGHPMNKERDGIVRVCGYGEIGGYYDTRKGLMTLHYLVTELIGDGMLEKMLLDPLTGTSAKIGILIKYVHSLEIAHAAGYVHNDVKPGNAVYCPSSGKVKILDFGIARPIGSKGNAEHILGTVEYMAPEIIRGEPVDVRTDIFAIGVMMYESFNYGRVPFEAHFRKKKPAPFTSPEAIILGIDEVAYRCLAFKPEERYQSIGELVSALRECMPPA